MPLRFECVFNLTAAFVGFVLMQAGRIRVRAYRGDDEIRLGNASDWIKLRSEWEAEQAIRRWGGLVRKSLPLAPDQPGEAGDEGSYPEVFALRRTKLNPIRGLII